MNHAPRKTPRVRPGHVLFVACVSLLVAGCGGDDSGRPSGGNGGRTDRVGPVEDVAAPPDTAPPVDVVEDTGAPDTAPDAPPPADVPPPPAPEVTFAAPADGAAIPREEPIVFRVEASHPDGITAIAFRWGDETLESRDLTNGGTEPPAESGTFEFVLSDYFVPDDEPLPGPDAEGLPNRRYPAEGEHEITVGVRSGADTSGFASLTVYVDGTAPTLTLRDAPMDRGLDVLDVVGSVRVAFRAGDEHELKESRVRLVWEEDGEAMEDERVLVPTLTSEYIVVFEVETTVDRADLTITTEDAAGNTREIALPVRIIGRPPYRLGHVFEFPNGATIAGYAIGDYDGADAYPDLWVSTSDGLWLLLGKDDGEFQGGFKLLDFQQAVPSRLFLHDFDGDGLEDVLMLAADGGSALASVAIRIPAEQEGTIDTYRVYPPIEIPGGTTAAALALTDEDEIPDLVVGLADTEDSVAVLRGNEMPDLPLTDVFDPLAPAETCDPACPSFMTCHNGRCVLESADECDPPCGSTGVCLDHPSEEIGFGCVPYDDEETCAGCPEGTRCFQGGCRRVMTNDCEGGCADLYTCLYGACIFLDTGDCEGACVENEICHNGVCVLRIGGDPCDPECGERQVCQDGACVRAEALACDPPCWGGEICHVVEADGQPEGRCVRRCDDDGCGEAPDEPPFFQRPHFLRGVAGITDLDIADFNNDGINDIVVGRSGVRQITCYIGKGDGDFLDGYDTYLETSPVVVHPVRFNANGEDDRMDLVVATDSGKMYILEGEGTGFFEIFDIYGDRDDNIRFGGAISQFATAQVFTDIDLVTVEPEGSRLQLFRYSQTTDDDPTAAPRYLHTSAFSAGIDPGHLVAADMDADGFDDIVYVNQGTGRLVVGLNMGNPPSTPSEDFDIPPEILMFPQRSTQPLYPPGICHGADRCFVDNAFELIDIEIADMTANTVDQDDLVMLVTGPIPEGEIPVQELGLDAPSDCGGTITFARSSITAVRVVGTNGVRPRGVGAWTWMNDLFGATPSALAIGKFDGDAFLDVAVAIPREPDTWDVARECVCETIEEETVCSPDPESVEEVFQPNVAILRNAVDEGGTFEPYVPLQPNEPIDVSVRGLGFATIPEEGEIGVADPGNWLPDTDEGMLGVQVPLELIANEMSRDGLDDLIVLSDELPSPSDLGLCAPPGEPSPCFSDEACYWGACVLGYAPPTLTTWRAPPSEDGAFDGPRFGLSLGRLPVWWTFIQANPLADNLTDLLISNTGDDDVTLITTTGSLAFRTPRFLATAATPTGIHGTRLEGAGDFGEGDDFEDFVVAVEGNVQIAYGRRPDTGEWAYEDVVFLYPGGTYPRQAPRDVHAFDFNRDSRRDIIVANEGSDTATMFFGVGERLFPAYLDVNTGHEPTQLRIADFNGDACKDYAIGNAGSDTVTLLLSVPGECPE